jgi:hypothetical protein
MNAQQPIARADVHARERLANWLALLALLAIGIVWPFAEGTPGARAHRRPGDAPQATARAEPAGSAARLARPPGRPQAAPRRVLTIAI